jgi:hypothetical protein
VPFYGRACCCGLATIGRVPVFDRFNWALDYFDVFAHGDDRSRCTWCPMMARPDAHVR